MRTKVAAALSADAEPPAAAGGKRSAAPVVEPEAKRAKRPTAAENHVKDCTGRSSESHGRS